MAGGDSAQTGGERLSIQFHALANYQTILKKSLFRFVEEDMPTHAAALSYYMVFSLPSMLLIVLWTTARFYREATAREAIFAEIGSLVGEDGAQQVMATLEKLNINEPSWWAASLTLAALLFFATTVFDAMRTALNHVALVKSTDSLCQRIWKLFRIRFIAIALLVGISFLLVVFLVVDALITAAGNYLAQWSGDLATYVFTFGAFFLGLGSTTVLYTMYFRYVPDVRIKWGDLWFGALLTAGSLTVGKHLIAFFIGNSEVANLYDAAGSILVLMLWVYYASAIFLFGATFTFTRAELLNKEGNRAEPIGNEQKSNHDVMKINRNTREQG